VGNDPSLSGLPGGIGTAILFGVILPRACLADGCGPFVKCERNDRFGFAPSKDLAVSVIKGCIVCIEREQLASPVPIILIPHLEGK
jgi:hypothetical protein